MNADRMDEIRRQIEAGEYETILRVAGTVRDMLEPPVAYVSWQVCWDLPVDVI